MSNTERKTRMRDVLSRRFLLNYVIILLITCWFPLITQTVVAQDENGVVLSETVSHIMICRSYMNVIREVFTPGAGNADTEATDWAVDADLVAVLVHLVLCFVISYIVWYVVLRLRRPAGDGLSDEPPA